MFRIHASHNRSTLICMTGLALAGAALAGCDGDDITRTTTPGIAEAVPLLTQVQNYSPSQDTWVRRTDAGPVDWGPSIELRTNNVDAAAHPESILLRFDVDLNLVCASLGTATLSLQTAQLVGPLVVEAHRVTSPWIPGVNGAAPAVAGCQAFSGDPAPFAPPAFLGPVAATLINDNCTRFDWNVTSVMQDWCNGAPNLGIRLDGHAPAGNPGAAPVNFFSMEALVASRHPKLTITY